jgi:hypothetical protein
MGTDERGEDRQTRGKHAPCSWCDVCNACVCRDGNSGMQEVAAGEGCAVVLKV